MYRSSDSSYKSWTSRPTSHSAPSYPTTSPGPIPGAPHLHTVSLPHPNSAPPHASSSSGSPCTIVPPRTSSLVTLLTPHLDHPSLSLEGTSHILSLNPLLSLTWTGVPPLYYNLTRDIQYIQLRPNWSSHLLHEPAVHPVCTHLVLSVPSLPWSVIEVRNSRGVSVYDVLVRIRDVLNRTVSSTEMSAMSVGIPAASEYFRARTSVDPREFAQGIKRFDFLGPNVFFAGLSWSRDRWEVHFVSRA